MTSLRTNYVSPSANALDAMKRSKLGKRYLESVAKQHDKSTRERGSPARSETERVGGDSERESGVFPAGTGGTG